MSSLVFVDSVVFLTTFDARDAQRQQQAQAWVRHCWTEHVGRISTQVLNNFYHGAITQFADEPPVQQARTQVRNLRQWQPPHLDRYTIDGAWALQDRTQIGYWDALIVSSAQQQGCSYLLTESLPHLQRFETVQVINPFVLGPADLENLSSL